MSISDGLVGWSIGYQYAIVKNKEDEIKQGKNYYLSAPAQASQISILMNAVSKINELLAEPSTRLVPYTANILSILAIPLHFFALWLNMATMMFLLNNIMKKLKISPMRLILRFPNS